MLFTVWRLNYYIKNKKNQYGSEKCEPECFKIWAGLVTGAGRDEKIYFPSHSSLYMIWYSISISKSK